MSHSPVPPTLLPLSSPWMPSRPPGTARASLILGIIGFVTGGLCSILGLIFGLVSLRAIRQSQGRLGGRSMALSGTWLSIAGLLTMPVLDVMVYREVQNAMTHARMAVNLHQMTNAIHAYSAENRGFFPSPPERWAELIKKGGYIPDEMIDGEAGARNFAFNSRLRALSSAPSRAVLLFERRAGSPPAGGKELLPDKPQWGPGFLIAFVDGHVEFVPPHKIDTLDWGEDRR